LAEGPAKPARVSRAYTAVQVEQSTPKEEIGMWREVDGPGLRSFERMLGFSLPVDGRVAIVAYDGIHVVDLTDPSSVEFDDSYPEGGDIYDWRHQVLEYQDNQFEILGLYGGDPFLMNQTHDRLALDLEKEVLTLEDIEGRTVFEFRFRDLSGDWGYATFSRDFRYILLGIPYALHVFIGE
jgi:hypothetical protein